MKVAIETECTLQKMALQREMIFIRTVNWYKLINIYSHSLVQRAGKLLVAAFPNILLSFFRIYAVKDVQSRDRKKKRWLLHGFLHFSA